MLGWSIENVDGVRLLKFRGITRFIWMPRKGNDSAFACEGGILVLGWRGWCVVVAPFAPEVMS